MAVSNTGATNVVSFRAGAAVGQFKVVYNPGTVATCVVATGATDLVLGVSQSGATAAGGEVRVAVGGIAKLTANSAISPGSLVISGAGGFGSMGAQGAGTNYVGVAVGSASGSGVIFEVLVDTARA